MKITFKNQELEDLYVSTKLTSKKYSKKIIKHYQQKINLLKHANGLSDIAKIISMNLEKLNDKKYKNCYSIRVNIQYRIIFRQVKDNIEILIIELSKHYE